MDTTANTLEAMRRQEESFYAVRGDYLCGVVYESGSSSCEQRTPMIAVDYANRQSMVEWSYKVVDFLSFSHETVEVAVNLLDRFLLTRGGAEVLACTKRFQLATMACLYIAVKINEEVVLDSKFMANLSHGLYSFDQVEDMEVRVLWELQWRVNPPTTLSFVREYMDILPSSVSQDTKRKVMSLCKPQSEVAVVDYNFVQRKPSTIGFYSVMNALRALDTDSVLLTHIESLLTYSAHVESDSLCGNLQDTLYDAMAVSSGEGGIVKKSSFEKNKLTQREPISPRYSFDESPCGVFSVA